jgi:hypothetical protein
VTVRQKRFGVWESVDPAVLASGPGSVAAPTSIAGEQLVLVDPGDEHERAWLADADARGATVHVGDGRSTVLADLREVQPTWLRAPPEVWQRLRDEVERRAADAPLLGRFAYRHRVLVRRAVRRSIGLSRVRHAESTGWLDPSTIAWFRDFGIEIAVDVGEGIDG